MNMNVSTKMPTSGEFVAVWEYNCRLCAASFRWRIKVTERSVSNLILEMYSPTPYDHWKKAPTNEYRDNGTFFTMP